MHHVECDWFCLQQALIQDIDDLPVPSVTVKVSGSSHTDAITNIHCDDTLPHRALSLSLALSLTFSPSFSLLLFTFTLSLSYFSSLALALSLSR